MRRSYRGQEWLGAIIFFTIVIMVIGSVGGCMAFGPQYSIWANEMDGKADYAKAVSTRQIQTLNAKAKAESAQYERKTALIRAGYQAEAEVIRANGVAKANKIIGESLHGRHEYLQWLWINNLENNKNAVYYIPTEGSLPILEAGRRK